MVFCLHNKQLIEHAYNMFNCIEYPSVEWLDQMKTFWICFELTIRAILVYAGFTWLKTRSYF